MLRFYSIILFFICHVSCSSEKKHDEADIIVKFFLQVVGTTGYKTLSLRPSPSDSNKYLKREFKDYEPYIIVSDSLLAWNKFQVNDIDLSKYVPDSEIQSFKEYSNLLQTKLKKETISGIAKYFPQKIGNYYLAPQFSSVSKFAIVTGNVKFSRVLIQDDIATFLATISIGQKSGITKLFLLKKFNSKYIIIRDIDLVVW